jgi:hypothetical protein
MLHGKAPKLTRAAALDIPAWVATITALSAVVVGGGSQRKAHGQHKALTVATKARTKFS